MPIELRHLRYFVAVADELHFGRAAERLGMSQPPLSQQIRQLEGEMDVRLFLRDSRRVELTEAGRAFLTEARAILARVDEAVEQARRAQRGETGELRIGMTRATPLSPQIPAAIFAFRRQSPAVHLHLLEMNTLQQIDALLDHRLDLGIIRKRALPEALASQALFRDPLAVVMRGDHPALASLDPQHPALPLRLLAQEPFVTFDRSAGAGIHDQVIALCSRAGFTRASPRKHANPRPSSAWCRPGWACRSCPPRASTSAWKACASSRWPTAMPPRTCTWPTAATNARRGCGLRRIAARKHRRALNQPAAGIVTGCAERSRAKRHTRPRPIKVNIAPKTHTPVQPCAV
jgi:DNA-binding transcriptional LysR family regulator